MARSRSLRLTLFVGLSALAAGAWAAPSEDLLKECASCHGKDGASTEKDIPTIAGLSPLYFSDSLHYFKDKERPCDETEIRSGEHKGQKTDMCKEAGELSDDQIEQLAEYYAAKPFVRAKQSFDEAKATMGAEVHDRNCEKCHENAGSSVEDDAGIMAGQWMDYLRKTFKEYSSGKRPMTEKMQVKYEKLNADELEALLHYYASQQ